MCFYAAVRVFSRAGVLNRGLGTPRGQQGSKRGAGEKLRERNKN